MNETNVQRCFLTSAQYQIWMGAGIPGNEGLYTMSACVRLRGVDVETMVRQAGALALENDALCLRIENGLDSPVQYVGDAPVVARQVFASEDALQAYAICRAREPFSLTGPLSSLEVLTGPDATNTLLIRAHHIALDGAGMSLLCERFCAKCAGKAETPLPSFLEYARDNPWNAQEADAQDEPFWKTYLAGAAKDLKLRPISAGLGTDADWRQFGLPADSSEQIRHWAQERGFSPFQMFLGAFALWISRTCGNKDVTIYVPRFSRNDQKQRMIPGMFTQAVPVRVQVDEELAFSQLCSRVSEQSKMAAAHRGYGLSSILSDASEGGPLSNYTLSFYTQPIDRHGLDADIDLHFAASMSNLLTLHIGDWSHTGAYTCKLDSRQDYWHASEIEQLFRSLCYILEQAVSSDPCCGQIEILPPDDQAELVRLLRGPASTANPSDSICTCLRACTATHATKPALICQDRSFTYAQLQETTDLVARNLLSLGAAPGDVVALLLKRTSHLPLAILGALKAGCAFLPMDCSYPSERVRYLLEDSGAKLLVSDLAEEAALPTSCALIPPCALYNPVDETALPEPAPDSLAYIIYTSGTTGKPKGVMVEHRNVVNLVQPQNNPFNEQVVEHGRALVAVGAICFDISVFELFVPLLNGVPVVFANEDEMRNPEALASLIQLHKANIIHCTPSRLLSYLDLPSFQDAIQNVDLVLSAGESFTKPLLDVLHEHTSAQLYNGYGPTETTVGATLGLVTEDITIGTPMMGARIYILDEQHRILPAGALGEIAIGGAGVARGYLGRAELTAEKFPDWTDGGISDHLYLTGDLGWCLPDGRIMYAGRRDNQVQVRGLRIELGEVESCVEHFPGVRQSVALVRKVDGREHLLCYYTANQEMDSDALKDYATTFLTRYMVPDWFFFLEDFPQTSNGKIDRLALESLEVTLAHPYTEPATPMEEQFCYYFSQVLGLSRVGAQDNFFNLGGTSLLAVRVVLLAKRDQLAIEYGDLFAHSTPRALALYLEQQAAGTAPGTAQTDAHESLCSEDQARRLAAILEQNQHYTPGLRELGTVLLTGATGFLGIHLLAHLLHNTKSVVYCLVRPKGNLSGKKRLFGSLFYYFEDSLPDDLNTRLIVVEGDLDNLDRVPADVHIDTVFNCAANVSHFGADNSIHHTNTDGAINLANFCIARDAELIHISTMSVGGFIPKEQAEAGMALSEQSLWFGQDLSNVYILSKFEAERDLLLATERGLKVKMMRVGNLQGRVSDGEFQMNRISNGFTKLLYSIVQTGKCPEELTRSLVNFSPVDAVASSICLLAGSDSRYHVFHIFDVHGLPLASLIELLPELGYVVNTISDEAFDAFLVSEEAQQLGDDALAGFLTRINASGLVETPCKSEFSQEALEQEGFQWPVITKEYLRSYLNGLETLGFFHHEMR